MGVEALKLSETEIPGLGPKVDMGTFRDPEDVPENE